MRRIGRILHQVDTELPLWFGNLLSSVNDVPEYQTPARHHGPAARSRDRAPLGCEAALCVDRPLYHRGSLRSRLCISEERRVGQESLSTCRSQCTASTYNQKGCKTSY